MHRIFACLLATVVIAGCGSPAAATPQPLIPTPTEIIATPLPRPGINYPPDPQSVVQSFLSAVQLQTEDVDPLPYLAPALQAQVVAGTTIPTLLDATDPIEWFEVATPQRTSDTTATVTATLHFTATDAQRHFTLTEDTLGYWQISAVTP